MTAITRMNYVGPIRGYVEEFGVKLVDLEAYFSRVESGLAVGMTEREMAWYCSEVAASMITLSPNYNKLASVILVKYLHQITRGNLSEKFEKIQQEKGILNESIYSMVMEKREAYDSMVDYGRDYNFDYFGLVSLIKSYLIKVNGETVESPQDMYMRVAIQIHRDNHQMVEETYRLISSQHYTHATPTLYNSCFKKNQLASCFLVAMKEDTILGIFETIKESAIYSKLSGGIGIHLSNLRSNNSPLVTTGGVSKGIIPIIKLINDSMKYINQGGARRCATAAFYLEPWHKDIQGFLDLRKNTGTEEYRARDSFTALWVGDLFMERVEKGEMWSLFDPNVAKGLDNVYGDEFRQLYEHYEKTVDRDVIPAQKLWKEILCAQIETGTPYMVYKDSCNRNCNQNNMGTIKTSNLCAEIVEYTDSEITAVCNLASICLPKYVKASSGGVKYFDFNLLRQVVKKVVVNMDTMIDTFEFPTNEAQASNNKTRPLGIGVQGLADTFMMMRYAFESEEAVKLNKMIFETIYYAAMETSCELAQVKGVYPCFNGSMYSKGIFHFEVYANGRRNVGELVSGMWDWEGLRAKIRQFGVRNSLTTACMPTAGTAQVAGNSECIEPIQSNIFTRRTFAGEFQIVNKFLVEDLKRLNLWSNEMRQLIIEYDGSIQHIPVIPDNIKQIYKTFWEMKMKNVLSMANDRQAFIDQSQSLNLFVKQPTYGVLSSMHFYGWKLGLKTGMYYLRTCPVASAIKFTVNKELIIKTLSSMKNQQTEDDENEEPKCEVCSC